MEFLDVARILAENEISFGVEFRGCSSYQLNIDLSNYSVELNSKGDREFDLVVHPHNPKSDYFRTTIPESDFERAITQLASEELDYPIELMFCSVISKNRFWEIIDQNPDLVAVVTAHRRIGFYKDSPKDCNLIAEIKVGD